MTHATAELKSDSGLGRASTGRNNPVLIDCPPCHGLGYPIGRPNAECQLCKGRQKIWRDSARTLHCNRCNGTGLAFGSLSELCPSCGGYLMVRPPPLPSVPVCDPIGLAVATTSPTESIVIDVGPKPARIRAWMRAFLNKGVIPVAIKVVVAVVTGAILVWLKLR